MIPKLRFPEFNDSWNKIEVDSLGEIKGGGTPSKQIESYWNGTIYWISSSDLMEESIWEIKTHRFISKEALINSATKLIPEGSILIVTRVGLGKVALSDKPLCTSQDFSNLILKPNYSKPFIAYVVKNLMLKLSLVNQGTSIKGVTTKTLKSAEVIIPSFSEQQRIEQVLKSVDQKINLLTKKKEALETYKKGLMQKIFSQELRFKREDGTDYPEWEVKTLGDVGEVKMCKRIFNSETNPKGEIPFYKIGTFGKSADAFIDKQLYETYRNKYSFPKKGEILISASGTLGRRVLYKGEDAYFQDSNIVWIANDEELITNEFLFYLYEVVRYESEGGTIKRLYNSIIKRARISVPSIAEQDKIVAVLAKFDALITSVSEKLGAAEQLKKGLLQQMFV